MQEKYAKTSRNPTEFQEAVNTYSECAERARASLERKMQKQPEQRQLLENKLQEAIKNTCPELYFAIGTF